MTLPSKPLSGTGRVRTRSPSSGFNTPTGSIKDKSLAQSNALFGQSSTGQPIGLKGGNYNTAFADMMGNTFGFGFTGVK